jgi:hypothetical protein
MAENNIDNYLRWITPKVGDPTYSLLKAHLLFEELLRTYLARVLPHPNALDGSRLTFVQLLAIARASSTHVAPDYWIWKAIGDLNKMRNMLSHEARPKDLAEKVQAYAQLISQHTKVPLPEPTFVADATLATNSKHLYSVVDMVTLGLYYSSAAALGFNVDAVAQQADQRVREMQESIQPSPGEG